MPGAATLRDCGILESMVKKHAADGQLYAAICAAPAVALGSWGLLKGLKVIKHLTGHISIFGFWVSVIIIGVIVDEDVNRGLAFM